MSAILADQIKPGDVVVIRYEGPKGGPGMREMLSPTSAIIEILLRQKVNVNAKNKEGKTALDYAKREGKQEIVSLLQCTGTKES